MRLQKHDLYMTFAKLASMRSTCANHSEGAILLIDNIMFMGYTGNLPKQKHCKDILNESGKRQPCNCNSAELNVIFQVTKSRQPVSAHNGATLYTTDTITIDKLNQLVSAGVTEIVYKKENQSEEELRDILEFAKYNEISLLCYEDETEIIDSNVNEMLLEVHNLLNINK